MINDKWTEVADNDPFQYQHGIYTIYLSVQYFGNKYRLISGKRTITGYWCSYLARVEKKHASYMYMLSIFGYGISVFILKLQLMKAYIS